MSTRSEGIFDVAQRQDRIAALNELRLEPGYWDNPAKALEVEKTIAAEQEWVDAWRALKETS